MWQNARMNRDRTVSAKLKSPQEQSLLLPAPPIELCRAEADLVNAREGHAQALRHAQIARHKVQPGAFTSTSTQEEIAAAEAKLNEAKATLDAIQVRRDRLRLEYQTAAREALAPSLAKFNTDVAGTADRLAGMLADGRDLQSQARRAGITLAEPLVAACDQLTGILKLLRTAMATLERR
jgi:chromosome segregation ATPase